MMIADARTARATNRSTTFDAVTLVVAVVALSPNNTTLNCARSNVVLN